MNSTTTFDPGADPAGFLQFLVEFATKKEWLPAFGLLLVGLVYLARKFGSKLPGIGDFLGSRVGGYVLGFATSALATFGTALAAGVAMNAGLLLQALASGLAASGIHEAIQDTLKS